MRQLLDDMVRRSAWEELAKYLEDYWVDVTQNHPDLLVTAFNAMPRSVINRHARLAAAREYANFIPARGPARPVRFQHAVAAQAGLLDRLAHFTSRSAGARMAGGFADAVDAAGEARKLLAEAPAAEVERIRPVLPDLLLQWAISLELGGLLPGATRAYERAYDEALRFDNVRIAVEAAGSVAYNFALLGMPTQARQWLARVPEYRHDGTDTVDEMGAMASALLYARELDLAAAHGVLRATPAVSAETWAMRFGVESFLAALEGRSGGFAARKLAICEAQLPAVTRGGINGIILAMCTAESAADSTDPLRISDAAAALSDVAPSMPQGILAGLRAWLMLRDGDLPAASAIASEALSRGIATPGVAAELHAVLAIVNLRHGQDSAAVPHFRAALEAIVPDRLYDVLHRFAPDERERLERLAGAPIPREARIRLENVSPRAPHSPLVSAALTPRERVVLRHLVDGRSRAEIAEAEGLSPNTIKAQIRSIYRKLGVTDRDAAVRAAAAAPSSLR